MAAAEGAPPEADATADEATAEFMAVVDQAARVSTEAPKYAKKAWVFLDRDAFPRKYCIKLLDKPWFDPFILVLIGMNCLTMMIFNEPVLKKMVDSLDCAEMDMTREDCLAGKSPEWAADNRNVAIFKPATLSGECPSSGPCSIGDWIDFTFLMLFAVEMVIKMTAMGLMMHPNSYLRNSWNWLDFLVVIIGFVDMFSAGLPGISTLRLIKTLRPLRSLQRIRGMRVLVQCIMEAMPQMCNVLVFLLFIIIFFGLFGVAFFKGTLRHTCHALGDDGWESTGITCDAECKWDDASGRLSAQCGSLGETTHQQESYFNKAAWTYSCRAGMQCLCESNALPDPTCSLYASPNYAVTSFDSLPWAMISLFQAISLEGWVDMMYQLMDGCSAWVFTYFVLLVLFGAIIVINLFLAVLCDNFEMADKDGEEKVIEESGAAATEKALKKLDHKNPLRKFCLYLVKLKYFDWFIQGCILINTAFMMMKYSPQPRSALEMSIDVETDNNWDYMPKGYWFFLAIMNIMLTTIFTFESAVKIIGLGPRLFVRDYMNLFDLFVVFFSVVEIIFDLIKKFTASNFSFFLPLSVLRAFRIFRLFKLVRSIESMRKILTTLAQSLASVFYLALLLGLIVLIFILLGMELFGGFYPRPELNYTKDNFPKLWENESISWDNDDDWPSRYHFDDIGNAFLAIFVVLSGENWNEIMFHSHRATWDHDMCPRPWTSSWTSFGGGRPDPHDWFTSKPAAECGLTIPFALIYFIGLFIIGNLLLFNLFIAILLSNFEDEEEEEGEEEEEDVDDTIKEGDDAPRPSRGDSIGTVKPKKDEVMMEWKFNGYMTSTTGNIDPETRKSMGAAAKEESAGAANGIEEEDEEKKVQEAYPKTAELSNNDKSMGIFSWQNPVRQFCANTIHHWFFEAVVLFLILFSTITLIFDMPHLPEGHSLKQFISVLNWVFAILFLIEMLLKWIALGVFVSKTPREYALAEPYFASLWNWLDGFIVVISLVCLLNIPALNPLRVFRSLRPLRLVSRYEDLKITVATLAYSVPAMGSLVSIALLFFIIFAILGLELYGGKMGYCMDPKYEDEPYGSRVIPGMSATGQTDYEECMALPRYNLTRRTTDGILLTDMAEMFPDAEPSWLEFTEFPQWFYPQFGNFDHLGTSLALLFEVSALEGWPDVMHVAMDTDSEEQYVVPWRVSHDLDGHGTTGFGFGGVADRESSYDYGPGKDLHMEKHVVQTGMSAIFFVLWIFVGCFVVVNMTIGVVVDTFSQIKAENDGLLLMSEDAADWVKAQKQVLATRPLISRPPPDSSWRLNVYYVVTSTKFEVTIMVVILCNMLQMGCDWWEPSYHEYPSQCSVGGDGVTGCSDLGDIRAGTCVCNYPCQSSFQMGEDCVVGDLPFTCRNTTVSDDCEPNAPYIVDLKNAMSALNWVFLVIYILEMLTKWVGLSIYQYFRNPWDIFDFILVVVSTVEVIISSAASGQQLPFDPMLLRVLRLFRVVRILRVIKTAKNLRTIIMTVWISLPQLQNIIMLIMLIIIIFDMLCVSFFYSVNYTPGNFDPTYLHNNSRNAGEVLPGGCPPYGCNAQGPSGDMFPAIESDVVSDNFYFADDGTNWGDMINRHANFQFWWTGMLVLIRSSTGESFNGLMHDCFGFRWGHNRLTCCPQCGPIVDGPEQLVTLPGGDEYTRPAVPEGSCGTTWIAMFIVYFPFQLIMAYIVLSIMIGVILENFANVGSETRRISMDDLEEFREVWLKYDPKGTFIVPSHNLLAILQQLKKPLGIAGAQPALTRAEMLKHLGKLDIPDHGGYIHFMETLTAISHHHAGVPVPVCDTTKKMQKSAANAPHLKRLDKPAHNALTNYLVSLLQSRWRGYAMRKEKLEGQPSGAAPPQQPQYELAPSKVKASQVMPEPQ